MDNPNEPRAISRRQLIVGAAATAGVAAAVGGVYGLTELVKSTDEAAPEPHVISAYLNEPVPAEDPDSSLWRKSSLQRIILQGQNVIVPLKTESALDEVSVRSLHDGETIAFLLEWKDPEKDEHTIKSDQFRDACGVMLGAFPAPAALWTMGMPDSPVSILHWKADWQLDIDAGFQDLEVAFPNVSSDFYPPLVGVVNPKIPDDYPEEVRNRLPGWSVGNPISQPDKGSPVEKLRAIGPGTLEHLATQNATGRGIWENGKWKAVIARPMDAADEEEISIAAGQTYSIAFTVWSGTDTDRGSRKSLTNLGQLDVEATA
jgi:hypothetical protein